MDAFLNLIEEELDNSEKKTRKSRAICYSLKIGILTLSLIMTVVLGLKFENLEGSNFTQVTRNLAFVIGAIITFISGLMNFWNIEDYFLTNKSIVAQLKSLRLKYRLYCNTQGSEEQVDALKREFEQILDRRGAYFNEQTK